ncbi:MAG: LysM peptidoglycan-binding domain-containing protein [Bacteroidota bacterium]|jgi:nucleoid-associated protein YgaU|nr:LysM peptidoglycan-binding domain-containing protein [Bacteroidota bacterium]MCA6442122.1 LysM peptidoglycan-binding domain-containing protein [Bacteroidota bacterium]
MATPSKLEKLTVYAYKDSAFSQSAGDPYQVLINPEKYSHNYSVGYNTEQSPGTAAPSPKFEKMGAEKVGMELVFDATGIIPGSSGDVLKDVAKFKAIAYEFNGEIHSPNYLKLSWGSLIFNCHLISIDVNFSLFKPDGTPLRAKATVSFEGYIDEKTLALKEKKESPDLTHIIIFKSGDTLPNLCFKTYGSVFYYRAVAKVNNIINYRNIKPGTKLFFPPIKK